MLTRLHITCLLALTTIVWGGTLLVLGYPITWSYVTPFALTVSILTATCLLFEKRLWQWRIFRGWLVHQPDIRGTWRVRILSNWINPVTKESVSPIDGVMAIRQTFSTVSARLYTKESSSLLISQKLVRHDDDVYQLVGTYQNTPDVTLRGQRSEIHYGGMLLDIRGDPPTSLSGHYWTDREAKGKIELTERTSELLNSYRAGAKYFSFAA